MGLCSCLQLPDYGPSRHLISCTLLAACATTVLITINTFDPVEGLTPSPDADVASRTGHGILIAIIAISGIAAILHLLVLLASNRENNAREIEIDERNAYLDQRSWWENFLDPQLLNSPKHLKRREAYFETLVNDSRTYRTFLLLPSLSLVVILLIRLFMGARVFLGDPVSFDFGWKYGVVDGKDAEKSITYTPDINTYARLFQGVLSAFLATPAVMRGLLQLTEGRHRSLLLLLPYALSLYPTYSLIKRFIKARDSFAGSSFANNGYEWASGFILGLALGQLITASCSLRYMILSSRYESSTEEGNQGGRSHNRPRIDDDDLKASGFAKFLQRSLGLLLIFSVYSSAVLYGMTWFACEEGQQCVNTENEGEDVDKFSTEILIIMILVPSVIMCIGPCFFG